MQINTDGLFGGQMSWKNIGTSRKEVSEGTGIDASTMTRIKVGKEGFGPAAAKKAANLTGENAVDLYVASQVRAAKQRRELGEIDDATTGRIVGKILGGLKEFPGAQVDDEVARGLTELAMEASQGATKGAAPQSQMERLGRDGSGIKTVKKYGGGRVQDDESTATKKSNGTYGALGRNADGTARRKLV